ncbi:MAG: protein TolR [Gammaproteobacteria bacterium]|nr:protein TolR [Gammaproteobacteria bacterium]MDH3934342.1 protein TolR [Gammaproteobacteria bacterium]MDH3986318.1 protein TolR [Gammaproteobacteria bacterium]
MARHRTRKRPMAEINVVPYIDVMLVMLVIFMITAPLLTQGVKVDLPEASAEPIDDPDNEPLVVSVDAGGSLYLNVGESPDDVITEEDLVQTVAAVLRRQPKKSVLVRGDHAVDYGAVVSAMVLLQQAGAPNVGLVTEPPEQ